MDDDSADGQEYDYRKRGSLLPEGCKDLIDVFESKSQLPKVPLKRIPPNIEPFLSGKVGVEPMTVRELAVVLVSFQGKGGAVECCDPSGIACPD